MPKSSVKFRFFISVFGNVLRGVLNGASVLIIARALGAENYGELAFLLASFAAIKALLDMGTSSAFFTFLSQKTRNIQFILIFLFWQIIQFVFPLFVIGWIFPSEWVEIIWVGSKNHNILLAFMAVFFREQAWQTMVHIGESIRLTERVQILNVSISAAHLLLMVGVWQTMGLSIELVCGLVILEYLIVLPIAWRVLHVQEFESGEWNKWGVLKEYRTYCMPLIPLGWISFGSLISDRWFLQYFGGAKEQAYFSIGQQFSIICLLLTTSMLRIFWKEISEALEQKNLDRVEVIYRKTSRSFFIATVIFSGFVIPWSRDVTELFLGSSYIGGFVALAVMFLYPIHQSLGQISTTLLMASGKTKTRLIIGSISVSVSIPVSYFVQASPDALVPGFGLGAVGMAWKMVLLNTIWANLTCWLVSKHYNWKFDWVFQVVGLVAFLFLGWFSFEAINAVDGIASLGLTLKFIATLLLYLTLSGLVIWILPWLIAMTREELKSNIYFVLAPNQMK